MKFDKDKLIIDTDMDQMSFEALRDFAEEYEHTYIGKLVKEWLDYNAWDFAAWYIGDDL